MYLDITGEKSRLEINAGVLSAFVLLLLPGEWMRLPRVLSEKIRIPRMKSWGILISKRQVKAKKLSKETEKERSEREEQNQERCRMRGEFEKGAA